MIPPFNASSVLPPFIGDAPGLHATMSPYRTDLLTFVRRFATTGQRAILLAEWIDGSFVEHVEVIRGRPPADIDLVTFSPAPEMGKYATDTEFEEWVAKFSELFDPEQARTTYGCHAFFIDTMKRPELLIDDTRYWFGVFSHQTATALWKGMIQIPMDSNDAEARVYLAQLSFNVEEANHA